MVNCANCGAENDSDAVFCVACNHFLQWDEPEPEPRARRRRRSSGDLAAALDSGVAEPITSASATEAEPVERPAEVRVEPTPRPIAGTTAREPRSERVEDPAEVRADPALRQDQDPIEEPALRTVQASSEARRGQGTVMPLRPGDPAAGVQEIIAAIDAGREIAASQGRTDLDDHLNEAKQRLAAEQVQVVFCGQFKVGKSTMINALLQRAVCPVDADVVTAVPTIVRYAPAPKVTTYVRTDEDDRVEERERPLDEIDLLVTEEVDPADPERDRVVEVGLPHRMLKTGLALVDTPGVGGLDSAHGFLTLAALRFARGVVFVTDAAQELTAPELSFLKTAVERCPTTAVVVTKIDLYPHWRRIVELNRKHLADAGLDLPLMAVSSFLRLRAAQDPQLNAESGFADLVAFLARDVVARSRNEAAKTAAVEVEFVASQLEQQSAAERAVIEAPESTEKVVKELDRVQEQAKRLIHPMATWQTTLSDGIQDLVSDIEHDLQQRLRTVIHDVEEVIDSGDPKDTWEDTEVWLRRQIAIVTMANRDLLSERAEDLAQDVADHFQLPQGARLVLPLANTSEVDSVVLAPASSLAMPGGKLTPLLFAGRTGVIVGSVGIHLFAAAGPVVLVAIAGISLALGTGIGKKLIGDERKRQRTYRQQQAKAAARRFVDDVAFLINKETRDILRQTQRHLRDDFQTRAMQLERSAHEAMEAARKLGELDEVELAARARELQQRENQLQSVRAVAREVADAPAEAAPREVVGARG